MDYFVGFTKFMEFYKKIVFKCVNKMYWIIKKNYYIEEE